jgi:hypothetical protein
MGFDPLTDPLTVFSLSGVHTSKHTDLGQFDPAGGTKLTKVRRPP